MTNLYDNHSYPAINCDTGQHSQFLWCFFWCLPYELNIVDLPFHNTYFWENSVPNCVSVFSQSCFSFISNVSHRLAPLCIEWKFCRVGVREGLHTPLFVCALSQLWTLKCRDEILMVEERCTLLHVRVLAGRYISSTNSQETKLGIYASDLECMNKVNTLRASPQSLSWLEIIAARNTCSTTNIFNGCRVVY